MAQVLHDAQLRTCNLIVHQSRHARIRPDISVTGRDQGRCGDLMQSIGQISLCQNAIGRSIGFGIVLAVGRSMRGDDVGVVLQERIGESARHRVSEMLSWNTFGHNRQPGFDSSAFFFIAARHG